MAGLDKDGCVSRYQLPAQWVPEASSPGMGLEFDPSHPSSAEVKNMWGLRFHFPIRFHGAHEGNFTLTLYFYFTKFVLGITVSNFQVKNAEVFT